MVLGSGERDRLEERLITSTATIYKQYREVG